MKFNPHNYQHYAIDRILTDRACGLFMGMGLGKTVCALTAIDRLMYEDLEVSKVLIIAPKFVAVNVWTEEAKKWDHLKHLKISVVAGRKNANERVQALKVKADIYVINRENLPWLVNFYSTGFPYDMVVIDELSSFKDSDTARFRAFKSVRPLVSRVVGLTGTPGNLIYLWSQIYLLDQGQRLGKTLTAYREAYMVKKENGFGYRPRPGAKEEIYKHIGDICVSMRAEDYLELPGRIEQTVYVDFDEETQKKYDDFEETSFMETLSGEEVTAFNTGVLIGKLLQFSNGAVYDENRKVHQMHDMKLDALAEILDTVQGQQVLIMYSYLHDLDRIKARFKNIRELKTTKDVDAWNRKELGVAVVHPASMGHGLNLQYGGHIIIWFGLTHSLELWDQANARLDRQGQVEPVVIYRLLARETWDVKVLRSLISKGADQDDLMAAVKARLEFYRKNL